MQENKQSLLSYIKKYGKDKSWRELANQFGYNSEDTVRKIVKRSLHTYTTSDKLDTTQGETLEYNLDKGEIKVSHIWDHPPTPEEVIEHHRIDERKWKLSMVWMKMVPKGYLTSAQFLQKTYYDISGKDITAILDRYRSTYNPVKESDIFVNKKFENKTCLLLSLADFHLGKLEIGEQTLTEKIALYKSTLLTLLYKASQSHNVDEIVYLIGNDFQHSDNYQNQTTNLTQQDVQLQWYEEYEKAFELQAFAIDKIRHFCNKLTVVHVPANHDRVKSYYLAHALHTYFKPDSNIIFDRSAENTKVYTYGNNFIGFHHGDTDFNKLPLYFASKFPMKWGISHNREIVLGDKHHRKQYKFTMDQNEAEGIRMLIAPSLSGADKWHKDKGYDTAIRAGIARVYDYYKGYCAEYEQRV